MTVDKTRRRCRDYVEAAIEVLICFHSGTRVHVCAPCAANLAMLPFSILK